MTKFGWRDGGKKEGGRIPDVYAGINEKILYFLEFLKCF